MSLYFIINIFKINTFEIININNIKSYNIIKKKTKYKKLIKWMKMKTIKRNQI